MNIKSLKLVIKDAPKEYLAVQPVVKQVELNDDMLEVVAELDNNLDLQEPVIEDESSKPELIVDTGNSLETKSANKGSLYKEDE